MAWSPSSKARVCKTLIRGCDSHPGLKQKPFSSSTQAINCLLSVLEEGLEPSSLAALVPKTSAYTTSATPASSNLAKPLSQIYLKISTDYGSQSRMLAGHRSASHDNCGHEYFLAVARKFLDPGSRSRMLVGHRSASHIT